MRMEIPRSVEWILGELKKHGYEAYAVGGCVRDTLLGRVPGDWDITTSAKPQEVKAVFGRTIDTGLQHGTVTVMRDHVGYEITTYRIDGEYADGRHPKEVAFTSNLEEDLKRRDFTINAMAYSPETGIVDIFGGMEDLRRGVIRCVGIARERFTEDALRILRAIRFSAQLDFSIEEETWRALSEIAPNLAHVSKERIAVELTKILLSGYPERILMTRETGMTPFISKSFALVLRDALPAGEEQREKEKLCLLRAADLPAKKAVRWAAFLAEAGEEMTQRILKELKLDNDTITKARTLVRWYEAKLPSIHRVPRENAVWLRRVMSSMPDEVFEDLLLFWEILRPEEKGTLELLKTLAADIRMRGDCIRLKQLAVDGSDLLALGIARGPALGKTLNCLFTLVLEHPEWNQREILLKKAGECRPPSESDPASGESPEGKQ